MIFSMEQSVPHSLLQGLWVPSSPPNVGLCRLLLQRSVVIDHVCSTHLQSLGLVPRSRDGARLHIWCQGLGEAPAHYVSGAWDGMVCHVIIVRFSRP